MSNRHCYINQVRDHIINEFGVGKTSAELAKPNQILIPVGSEKLKTKEQTNEWAKRIAKKLYDKYNSKMYGPVVSIDTASNPNGTLVNITIPSRLIDGFERKYDTQSEMFQLDNTVNYGLKAISILESKKADEVFRKGDKNNWDIDKILTELAISKEQKELIKSFNTRNREEILTNLLASYSYTVEINIAKDSKSYNEYQEDINIYEYEVRRKGNSYSVYRDNEEFETNFNSTREANNRIKELEELDSENVDSKKIDDSTPTQYYSDLTVLGGTNYTENEIATPLITPSIKGHAQFSTDNGIGWFRSDDKVTIAPINATKENSNWNNNYGRVTKDKTRRILEVQSDIFQKSRDIKSPDEIINELKKSGELQIKCD